ncbi:DUF6779 domain-containing protein [Nocardia carnea]|uniref:DUF6779 domain-containing protein n=1 Tax=Nocardia carnea TaxID=37328 RepID=UPI002458A5DB|nr:DUF6779 domain-containing protein [Nocardia carnea]
MVSPSRSSSSARRREDVGKLFLGALVLLGLVASVFLVFSDKVQFLRVGLVVALWAAVLGAWAVSRYQTKVRDLRRTYEIELEREISARREHDLGVEARVRAEVGADASEMAALRAELAVLRRQLQRLFDGELPPERPALRAAAFRVQELPSAGEGPVVTDAWPNGQDRPGAAGTWPGGEDGERRAVDAWANVAASWSHAADGWVDPEAGEPVDPAVGDVVDPAGEGRADSAADAAAPAGERNGVTPVYDSDHPSRPRFASPDDAPVTAETAIVRLDDEPPYVRATADISGPSWSDAFTEVQDDPAQADGYGRAGHAETVQGPPHPAAEFHGPPVPPIPAQRPAQPQTDPAEKAAAGKSRERISRIPAKLSSRNSRRRRTQADPSGSRRLSVAEIMANLRQEEEQRSS